MPQYAEWIQEVSFPAHTGDLEVLLFKGINVRFPFLILQRHFNTQVCFQHFLNRFSYFFMLVRSVVFEGDRWQLGQTFFFQTFGQRLFRFCSVKLIVFFGASSRKSLPDGVVVPYGT